MNVLKTYCEVVLSAPYKKIVGKHTDYPTELWCVDVETNCHGQRNTRTWHFVEKSRAQKVEKGVWKEGLDTYSFDKNNTDYE